MNKYLFALKLTKKNASSAYFYHANKQENNIWAYLCSEIYQPQLKHRFYVAVFFFEFNPIKAGLDFRMFLHIKLNRFLLKRSIIKSDNEIDKYS